MTDWRGLYEDSVRRFHGFAQAQGAAEHRSWKFENCPAEHCRKARAFLGIAPMSALEILAQVELKYAPRSDATNDWRQNVRTREPGEEG